MEWDGFRPVDRPGSQCASVLDWLNDNGVKYTVLNYPGDTAYNPGPLENLSTWEFANGRRIDFQAYPFIIYTEMHDDLPINDWPKVCLYGRDEIFNSNIIELYQLGR